MGPKKGKKGESKTGFDDDEPDPAEMSFIL